ncbi:E3 ubiquitin-protein ligase ATL42-like [Curcuma longa]|uniref:E3 ubiquitin-protein ligase ATL42-like n=1 Tax=Curcuma longa TaxID=136217 RepID=UPI003D9E1D06
MLMPFLLLFSVLASAGGADSPSQEVSIAFRLGVDVVAVIFVIVFCFTLLVLFYARFCHHGLLTLEPSLAAADDLWILPLRHPSGIDKAAIDSLPFFRFDSLRGARAGLECVVCLSKFGDADVLRLLPKCKHAFHITCVDRWLEAHSTCPLCRAGVCAEDAALFSKLSASCRFLFASDRLDDVASATDLELFIEREPFGSSRFSIGSSFRRSANKGKEKEGIRAEDKGGNAAKSLHIRIMASDVMFKRRWSDVNSADLLSLSADMLSSVSSKRFSEEGFNLEPDGIKIHRENKAVDKISPTDEQILMIKKEMEKKRLLELKARQIKGSKSVVPFSSVADVNSRASICSGTRSMSEITNLSRGGMGRDAGSSSVWAGVKDEKLRRIWLPIARRTLLWFAGRERRSQSRIEESASA